MIKYVLDSVSVLSSDLRGLKPVLYRRSSNALELTKGELIDGQLPLLKCRREITRQEAIKRCVQKRRKSRQPSGRRRRLFNRAGAPQLSVGRRNRRQA